MKQLMGISVLAVVGLLGSVSLRAEMSEPVIQLVQSVPLETDLAQPGIPLTADVWLEMIKNAKSTLDLAQFYVSSNSKWDPHIASKMAKQMGKKSPLEPLIDEIEKAGKRGVKCRLLVSETLISEDPQTLIRLKSMKGVNVRIFDLTKLTEEVHHAKYWIVDGKEVFVGSQNFDWRSLTQIHELGVRVGDSDLARQLTRLFESDWKIAKTQQLPPENLPPFLSPVPYYSKRVELVASPQVLNPPEVRPAIGALLELIQSAKRTLHIQLLDYSPVFGTTTQVYWPDLDDAIRGAALRGVKVQMVLSHGRTTLKAMDYLKSLAMIPGIEIKTVTLPQFSGGEIPYARVIHSKYMVVDDESFWIGNSNWSKGYFYNSRNVELIIRKPDIAKTGNAIFQKIWASSYSEKIDSAKK